MDHKNEFHSFSENRPTVDLSKNELPDVKSLSLENTDNSRFSDIKCEKCREYMVGIEKKICDVINEKNNEINEIYKVRSQYAIELDEKIKNLEEKIKSFECNIAERELYFNFIKEKYNYNNDLNYRYLINDRADKEKVILDLKINGFYTRVSCCFH